MMEWIKCSDRLPNPYDFVLVFATTKGSCEPNPITLSRLIPGGTIWEFLYDYPDTSGAGVYQDLEWPVEMEDITHWMPLPKPPVEMIMSCAYCLVVFDGVWDYVDLKEFFLCSCCFAEILRNQKGVHDGKGMEEVFR